MHCAESLFLPAQHKSLHSLHFHGVAVHHVRILLCWVFVNIKSVCRSNIDGCCPHEELMILVKNFLDAGYKPFNDKAPLNTEGKFRY